MGARRKTSSPTQAPLSLAAFLPYRMNVAAQAVSHGLARLYAHDYGITIPEWRVLATLGEFGEMTARDIGAHSRMGKVMTSRAVATMIDKGLATRRANRADRREAFLSLSARGRTIYEEISPRALDYQQALYDALPREDALAFDRVIAHFMAMNGEDADGADAPTNNAQGKTTT